MPPCHGGEQGFKSPIARKKIIEIKLVKLKNKFMGNQIKTIWENFSKPECEKVKIRSEKKSKEEKILKKLNGKKKKKDN